MKMADLDLISDLTAGLEAATSIYDLNEECDEEGVCGQTICQYAGCVVDKIRRARATMAAGGWDHIPGDLDAENDALFRAAFPADA